MSKADTLEAGGARQLQYRRKTSFYQEQGAADRMRAAFLNTQQATGFSSLSEFINAAVDEKVAGLEQEHNDGHTWSPLGAGEIPQGKPVGLQPKFSMATARREALRERRSLALRGLIESAIPEIESGHPADRGKVRAFYREDGQEALIETYGANDGVPIFRRYDTETSGGEVWMHTSSGNGWEDGDGLLARESTTRTGHLPHAGGQAAETPTPDLPRTVENARRELEQQFSQRQVEIKVFYSPDGSQALVESYNYSTEISAFIHYAYDAGAGLIDARNSTGHNWQEWRTAPFEA
ncbi:hypothetical protein FBY31_4579 [Arthrobacter sp. SLBN-100]|nr:hypothetical protein FBY31_4579 [Arthrobacter sp. SLBN-100]